ncbi:ADGRL3 [Branchiostoma lanceolatum]|uniref:ADGRL3 protein n=1 Tax=Branchiostoma lanceolatum TaxID=7740 RepID=A0A8J9Z5L1_BRALA|nr:ADGRL3 [Branchiostoma lanceolatum]
MVAADGTRNVLRRWTWVLVVLCVLGAFHSVTGCLEEGYVLFNGVCYKDFAEEKTYEEARATCASDGGLLSMPKDNTTNIFIHNLAGGRNPWIGLNDINNEGQWVFEDGQTLESSGYSNWNRGEPNDLGRGEDCAVVYGSGHVWNDAPCSLTKGFICQLGETGRACERELLTITCAEGGTILVSYANYGRTSSTYCTEGPRLTDTDCTSDTSQNLVSQLCNGQERCSIQASNSVFGDPCVGTHKYLEVVYSCVRPGDATSTTEQMTAATSYTQGYCAEDVVETEAGQFVFNSTEGGGFSYSEERCPSSSAKPQASRFCRVTTSGTAVWDPPVFLTCDVSLRNLSQTTIASAEAALAVATELQVITAQANTLSSDDVTIASVLIQQIANAVPTEQIGDSLMTTVDNLMNVDSAVLQQSQQDRGGPTRVVQSLETFSDTVILTGEKYTSVRPGVALQAADISVEELDKGQGFAFYPSGNSSNSLMDGSVSGFTVGAVREPLLTADISITLPANLSSMVQINNTGDVRVSYTLYNDSSLFVQPSQGAVGTRIVGSRIAGLPMKNLTQPVTVTFAPLQDFSPEDVREVQCVYWDFEAEAGQGAWSNEGCMNQTEDNGRYTCSFNHLTNFAVFFDLRDGFGSHDKILEVITTIACVVSITGLVLTLLSFIVTMYEAPQLRRVGSQPDETKSTRRGVKSQKTKKFNRRVVGAHAKNQRLVLINLCVALLAILVIFLAGINQTASPIGCTIVAALLHYFLLAALIWMAMEAVNIYLATVMVFDHYVTRNFIYKAAAVAWGFPFLIAVSTAGPSNLYEYRSTKYCWLARLTLQYAFLLPAGLILLFNMVVFSIVMYKLLKGEKKQKKLTGNKKNEADHQWAIRQLRRAFSIMVLFGLTWVFGFFFVIDDAAARTAFAYLFCIFNTLQGLFIFVFHCFMREDVQKWRKEFFGKSKKKNHYVVNRSTFSSSVARTPQNISFNPSPSVSKA